MKAETETNAINDANHQPYPVQQRRSREEVSQIKQVQFKHLH